MAKPRIRCFLIRDTGRKDERGSRLYIDPSTGVVLPLYTWPPGAMWYGGSQGGCKPGPDGKYLWVMCPGGIWCIDSIASNCDRRDDEEHRCWVRHGVPPNVTVDKNGRTCGAGAGSILIRRGDGAFHGFLRNGWLEPLPDSADYELDEIRLDNETTKIMARYGDQISPFLQGYGVDFGCGLGPLPQAQVVVDGRQEAYQELHDKHEVHVRDINDGFEDWIHGGRQYDFVYSSHLLEHLLNPHLFLTQACAMLKPGGHLVLVLPDEDFYWPIGHPYANPDHKWWSLSPDKLMRWAAAAGFELPCRLRIEATAAEQGGWSFVVAFRKSSEENTAE